MKCGLLSLALLGTPAASGCWLRNSVDGRRTEVEGRNWAQNEAWQESLIAAEKAEAARAKRVAGKRALKEACLDNVHFSECSQDKGSAIRLERCLKARTGNKLSSSCQQGLQTWKQLLAETAHDARNQGNGPAGSKKAAKGLARAAHAEERKFAQEREDARLEARFAETSSKVAQLKARLAGTEFEREPTGLDLDDPDLIEIAFADPDHHPHPPHPHHHPHHPHHPPHPHHGGAARHAEAFPAFFFDDEEENGLFLQRQERRPSMFSVLVDWIFGDSSSSDSLDSRDSSSSSDDFVVSSTSVGRTISSSGSSSSSSGRGILVDAGFFPAGYGFVHYGGFAPADEEMSEEPPRRVHHYGTRSGPKPFPLEGLNAEPFARKGLRGANGVFQPPPEPLRDVQAEGWDFQPPGGFVNVPDAAAFNVAADVEETMEELARVYEPVEEGYESEPMGTMDLEDFDEELAAFMRAKSLRKDMRSGALGRGGRANKRMSDYGAVLADSTLEPDWELVAEEDLPVFAGGPHVRPKHHHRGDHIRFRNPLPEDFENQRAWLSDSFDVDGDGPDLVEAILAFFFFVGAMTLMLLPFFLLGRALKRMVRNGGGGGGGGGGDAEAPDGYHALPEDATSAAAAAAMVSADDDDSIVVTGTPVNPPPSVHL